MSNRTSSFEADDFFVEPQSESPILAYDPSRFLKFLRLTTSPNDAEALAAIRKASEYLRECGLEWGDVVGEPARSRRGPFTGPGESKVPMDDRFGVEDYPDIPEWLHVLDTGVSVTSSFRTFVDSVIDQWETRKWLTRKQIKAIRNAYQRERGVFTEDAPFHDR